MSEQLPLGHILAGLQQYYNPDVSPQPTSVVELATEVISAKQARDGALSDVSSVSSLRRTEPKPPTTEAAEANPATTESEEEDHNRMTWIAVGTFIFGFQAGTISTANPFFGVVIGAGAAVVITATGTWALFK